MTMLELASETLAKVLKLTMKKSGDHFLLIDEKGGVHLYLFRRDIFT